MCKIWQLLEVFGRWSLNTRTFLYNIIGAWNFVHKDLVVAEHRDRKWQVLLYINQILRLLEAHSKWSILLIIYVLTEAGSPCKDHACSRWFYELCGGIEENVFHCIVV